jgi:hypothetical protein
MQFADKSNLSQHNKLEDIVEPFCKRTTLLCKFIIIYLIVGGVVLGLNEMQHQFICKWL